MTETHIATIGHADDEEIRISFDDTGVRLARWRRDEGSMAPVDAGLTLDAETMMEVSLALMRAAGRARGNIRARGAGRV